MTLAKRVGSIAGAWLLLAHALLGCSLIVDDELEGKLFGPHEDGGGSSGSGGRRGDSGGGGSGRGGSGSGARDDGGLDAGLDAATADGAVDAGPTRTLSVVSTNPSDGESTTYRYTEVVITFSDAVQPVADGQVTVVLRESGDVLPGSLSFAGAVLTFTPDAPMLYAGHYDVTVDSQIALSDGTELAADYTFTFAVVAGFPDDAEYIDRSDTPGSSEPDVGVDADGNAIVVWLQRGAGGTFVNAAPWVAHYTYGVGWNAPAALDSEEGTAYSPKIAVAPSGTAIATWTHDRGFAMQPSTVMASHFTPSDGWSVPEPLDTDPDLSLASQHVAVGVNAAGDGIVAWARGASATAGGVGDFYVSVFGSGSFGPPQPITSNGMNVSGRDRIEADLTSDGLGVVSATMGLLGHAVFMQEPASAGGEWVSLAGQYDYTTVKGMALALDENDVVHVGSNAPESSGVTLTRAVMPLKSRITTRSDNEADPFVALAGAKDVVGAWLAQSGTGATTSVWALAYNHAEDDWALSASDLFPDRGVTDIPSPPDVAAYLGTGALIAWTSDGQLCTVNRSAGSYGEATPRTGAGEAALPWVRVAASEIGTGVLAWQEGDGVNPARIAAQSFRGDP